MELTQYQNYQQFKSDLDYEMGRTAEGFVKIGYLLRYARDFGILADSQYSDVNEFARAEYGLDKSQVSRFISINEHFSEYGYSDRLKVEYQGFGVAKLAIMLQLPEAVNLQLSPDMTKQEITAIKEEYKEEQKISDIEVMLEPEAPKPLFEQILDQIMFEHPDIYEQIWEENRKAQSMGLTCESSDFAQDVLAAAGEGIYTTRVQGMGKMMLNIRASKEKIIITNMRTSEQINPAWDELGRLLTFPISQMSASLEWEARYNSPWPIKEEPKEEPKKAPAKVVTTPKPAEKPKPVEKPKQEEPKKEEPFMNIPVEEEKQEEEPKKEEVAPVQQPESRINTQSEGDFETPKVETKTLTNLKDDIVKELGEVIGAVYDSRWADVQSKLDKIDFMVKGCISEELNLEEAEDE